MRKFEKFCFLEKKNVSFAKRIISLTKKGKVLFPLYPKGWSFHKTDFMKIYFGVNLLRGTLIIGIVGNMLTLLRRKNSYENYSGKNKGGYI